MLISGATCKSKCFNQTETGREEKTMMRGTDQVWLTSTLKMGFFIHCLYTGCCPEVILVAGMTFHVCYCYGELAIVVRLMEE